jgi:flavin-dependent dehydrogenase
LTNRFDIAVVGGGPAAATTALCLARDGWRVALVAPASSDGARVGETLPPEINPVLRQLGLWEPFLSQSPLASPGTISVWGSAAPTEIDFTPNPFGCGWHVERHRLDEMLLRHAADAGARIYSARVGCDRSLCIKAGDGWLIGDVYAAFLVDATGRNGLRLENSAERHIEDVLLAFVLSISQDGTFLDQRTCIETTPDGWWYSSLVPDRNSVAMFFTGAEVYRNKRIAIAEQLQRAPLTRNRVDCGRLNGTRIVYVPCGYRRTIFGENWVAVGDSASSYDPLSGRGILKALVQGRDAAQSIDARLRGNEDAIAGYASRVVADFEAYAWQRKMHYAQEQRWLNRTFWRKRNVIWMRSQEPGQRGREDQQVPSIEPTESRR